MTTATQAQRALIRNLSGQSVERAAQDYGFAPGHSLTTRDASDLIDSLKAPAATAPTGGKTFDDYIAYVGQCRSDGVAFLGQDAWKAL
jgi:hypothetical protein